MGGVYLILIPSFYTKYVSPGGNHIRGETIKLQTVRSCTPYIDTIFPIQKAYTGRGGGVQKVPILRVRAL